VQIENENDDDDEDDCSEQRVICVGSCVSQGWPRRPVRTEPLRTTLSVAQCSETFSVAYSFSLRFVDADLLEDKGDDYLKTAIERTKQE
jgi:hypothetical protein